MFKGVFFVKTGQKIDVVDCAIRHFGRFGYRGTSIRKIADECRISHGAIHKTWPTKVDLMLACLERSDIDGAAGVPGAVKDDSLLGGLLQLLRLVRIEDSEIFRMLFRLNTEECEETREVLADHFSDLSKSFSNSVSRHTEAFSGSPGVVNTSAVYMFVASFLQGWVLSQDAIRRDLNLSQEDFNVARSEMMDLVLGAIIPRESK